MSILARVIERAEIERSRTLLEGLADVAPQVAQKLKRPLASVRGWWAFLQELAYYAGLTRTQAIRLILRTSVECLVVVGATCWIGNFLGLLLLPEVLMLELGSLQRRVYRRAESFERDYTALLLSLASSVRTGLDPLMALTELYKLFHKESEIYRQLIALKRNIDSGMTESVAMTDFARDIRHPDLALFRTAFLLARREGSSLGNCLERLARVTRARQSFRRKARAAVAMQKLSALGIVGCCIAIAIIQFFANPEGFIKATQNPLGQRIMYGGITLLACGVFWMLRLARMKL